AFHTLFFLDFYLSDSAEGFAPPAPFGLEEMDPAGALPPRVYTKEELLTYLAHCREKCRRAVRSLTDEKAHAQCGSLRPGLTFFELHMYTMRHVQHHAAQLNLLLRQKTDSAPGWVSIAKRDL
ncbi:MAG: DinB family protein, partial [candidate division Zixibacteria bacterium]|nr:DinB family protein [candidate division Zixibacteria bacterium]